MTSNAYIASDGANVMKVGKANDVRRRERQIAIPMTMTIACLDEAAAFRVESQLRNFVIEQGGIQHQGTIDWFRFDPQIYAMLCEFAAQVDATPVAQQPEPEMSFDAEIHMLVARYRKLLIDEHQTELTNTKIRLKESERLWKEEREKLEIEIRRLNRENAVLEFQLEQLRGKKDDDE